MNYSTENEKLSREAGGASPSPTPRAAEGEQSSEASRASRASSGPYDMRDKPAYWAVLPAQVRYDPEIPANAKLLYAEISSLTDARGYCWASNAYFERLYDLSERTIVRLIRALEKAGYIRILDAGGGSARRKIAAGINPLGTRTDDPSACGAGSSPGQGSLDAGTPDKNVSTPLTKMSVPPDKNVTQISKGNKKEINPPKAPQGAAWEPEMFERFWKAYPCKRDKASARREWDRLEPDRKLMMTMSAALKRQKASEQWQREIGIPYACRWLRNRRWEDEVDAPGGPSRASAPTDERRDVLWI